MNLNVAKKPLKTECTQNELQYNPFFLKNIKVSLKLLQLLQKLCLPLSLPTFNYKNFNIIFLIFSQYMHIK